MKITLVITAGSFHEYSAPLGYLYVAAKLIKAGYEVNVINASIEGRNTEKYLFDVISACGPDIVITGTSYKFFNNCPSPTIKSAIEVSNLVKRIRSEIHTVIIGPINILYENLLLKNESINMLVLGEPENICLDVARAIEKGEDLQKVKGLSLRRENKITRTGKTTYPNLENIPIPARDEIDFGRYIAQSHFSSRTAEMITSRGCNFNCSFCFGALGSKRHDNNVGRNYRYFPAKKVVEEIGILRNKWNINGIEFQDQEFCMSKSRVVILCEEILRKGYQNICWRAATRITSMDRDLLSLMYRAGCRSIYYGVESGDVSMLNKINKGIDLNKVRSVFKDTMSEGIRPEASFLLGMPGETEETLGKTIKLALDIDAFAVSFHLFVPYPGILLEDQLVMENESDIDQWNVYRQNEKVSCCDIPAEKLRQLSKMAYRRFYMRPKYIKMLFRTSITSPRLVKFMVSALRGKLRGGLIKELMFGD